MEIGSYAYWQENKDLPRRVVRIIETDQAWITGGSRRPLGDKGYLVVGLNRQPFIAPPFTLKRVKLRGVPRVKAPKPVKIPQRADSMSLLSDAPALTLENIEWYQTGPKSIMLSADLNHYAGERGIYVSANNPSEAWIFAQLEKFGIRWQYEPKTFQLRGGRHCNSFRPDLYLPDYDHFVELTIATEEPILYRKNKKIDAMRTAHPDVSINLATSEHFIQLAKATTSDEFLSILMGRSEVICVAA